LATVALATIAPLVGSVTVIVPAPGVPESELQRGADLKR
jgi:hypothetical protein